MNKSRYIVLFSVFCGVVHVKSFAQSNVLDSAEYKKIMQIAEQTRARYAPDKRTAIVELHPPDGRSADYQLTVSSPEAGDYFKQLLAENPVAPITVTVNLLPDSSVHGTAVGVVNLSVANLRVTPSNQAELASQVLLGTTVDLLQQKDGYYRVRTPEGYIAWVSTSSITPKSEPELTQWYGANKVIFVADFGHSYTEPNEQSLRVSDLVMGNILMAEGETDGFIQVRYPDGREAFVGRELVRPFDAWLGALNPTAENVLQTAKTMMGLPYLWGGTSVKGVDCSGFTKMAYYMNGFIIPRDASQQVLAGQPVEILTADTFDAQKALQNLRPADLLFFASGTNRLPNARITHVALYLGNGEFIHAAGSVQINSFLPEAPNYGALDTRTLVAARRYIGQTDPTIHPITQHPSYVSQNKPNTHDR